LKRRLTPGGRSGASNVAGLRRGIWIDTYENDYGQYLQALSDSDSALHAFQPTEVLLALDAYHMTAGVTAGMDAEVIGGRLRCRLVGSEHLPTSLLGDLDRFHRDSPTLKVDWTLNEPIPWLAPEARRAGTVHLRLVRWMVMGSVPAAFLGAYLLRLMGHAKSAPHNIEVALGVALLVFGYRHFKANEDRFADMI